MKYRVHAIMETDLYLDVEAGSREEALEIAENADGGLFTTTNDGDWRITSVDEIK